ncbi:hypothetical protein C1S70_02330 (plasmid) [Azospirillum argentinense]|uniref:Uncharacterized protein n=1 Tax=Azospirillum argentinense TaxID=2970906 RepID=A0A2K1G652_9PROT|nr:hypothetical protein [Azospirillum argentinense]PNR00269.1 hypothetical protein C1S70_02330 [Azospirillum argentinense]
MSGVTNNRFYGARSWREAKPVVLHPRFFDGFQDVLDGRPFDYRGLDGWPLLDQHRYENGRELTAECRAAGIAVRWGDRTRIPRGLKQLVAGRARHRGEPRRSLRSAGRPRDCRSG